MKQKKQRYNNFIIYSGMAIQMVVVIVLFLLAGLYADKYFNLKFKWFTLLGLVLGLFGAFYLSLKDFLKNK